MIRMQVPNLITAPAEVLRAEIAVVGSGPGGAITAALLAEGGRDVALVEEGPFLPLGSCVAFSHEEMIQKYRNGGLTVAMGSPKVNYVEGRCVGGGSEVNSGLYHRTPPEVLERWQREFQVEALGEADLRPHFEAIERDVSVSYLPVAAPLASRKLEQGSQVLGWRSLEVPRWFRYQPDGRGVRQSMTETFVPRALAAGCRLVPDTRVLRLRRRSGRWQLAAIHQAAGRPARRITIEAETVVLAAGAVQTPLLLRRSGIGENVGRSLQLHPTIKVVAEFPEEVNSTDMGVPVHQVKEFAPRFSFGCSISSPAYLALAMADHPEHLPHVVRQWRRAAIYYGMILGHAGSVRPVPWFHDPLVFYRLRQEDLRELADAMRELSRCLLAAGAVALYPSVRGHPRLTCEADLARIPAYLPPATTSVMTIHLFSTCPMGENRRRCATDSFGRVHGAAGLRVADASLLCSAPGVNPQGSIMALVRRNALHILGQL